MNLTNSVTSIESYSPATLTINSADLTSIVDHISPNVYIGLDGSREYTYKNQDLKMNVSTKKTEEKKEDKAKSPADLKKYTPKRIVYNPPATIVFWQDGTKTVVKCADSETYSPYYGFVTALAKKVLGTNSNINRIVNTYLNMDDLCTERDTCKKNGATGKDCKNCDWSPRKELHIKKQPRSKDGKFAKASSNEPRSPQQKKAEKKNKEKKK